MTKQYNIYRIWKERKEKLPFFICHIDWSPNKIFLVEKIDLISDCSIKVYGTSYLSGDPETYEAALTELSNSEDSVWLPVTVSRKSNYFHSVSEESSYFREYYSN